MEVSQEVFGAGNQRTVRAGTLAIAGLVGGGVVAFLVWRASSGDPVRSDHLYSLHDDSAPVALDRDAEARVVAFCSDCHAIPRPQSFPRDRWHREVSRGYTFYARSGRNDLDPPPMHETIAYFRSRAPQRIAFPKPEEAETELRATFRVEKLAMPPSAAVPEISHLRWAQLGRGDKNMLLLCDMRHGYVSAADLDGRNPYPQILARLNNPVHVEPVDLDGDLAVDLVVADLGSARPNDHDWGRVVWLRGQPDATRFEEVVLASNRGRIADVRPADFDADGDLDLVVAEFGHYQTGEIFLLRNVAERGERPRFEPEVIDGRPGTINVPVHDFNGDGRPDFLALVSQDWERVEAFINQGDGRFRLQTLWAGPDLTFGSSGIELVDLDRDGDMDVLYTNGDCWDNWYVNTSHGIQWLENRGDLQFAYHRLADMPGVYRALPGDFDGDGDLDVLAVAWLPPPVMPSSLLDAPLVSILCLEQTEPGTFVRHTLESDSPLYATVEAADFDGDGDLDFAVGPGPHVANAQQESHWLAVWWNQTIGKDGGAE